ncbi:hypothetical protein [Chromatium okenii]|uniref:hypothetical protein n=1 Tax=Chromatium okenii TaxID=61644 RepID=UPI0026ED095C|nr:hypothetical protein [Chromatium okenii]MBV5311553.1 hypothetical protein [Chromatium okenii]
MTTSPFEELEMIDPMLGIQHELMSALLVMRQTFNAWMNSPAHIRNEMHPFLLESIDSYHATRREVSAMMRQQLNAFEE